MTPAALHRQLEPRGVSEGFVLLSSRLLLWSMLSLALGISTDLYLIARLIFGATLPAMLLAMGLFAVYCTLWFLLPQSTRLQRQNLTRAS
jgi:hypothetical protein